MEPVGAIAGLPLITSECHRTKKDTYPEYFSSPSMYVKRKSHRGPFPEEHAAAKLVHATR